MGDDRLHLHREHELPGFSVLQQNGVFRGLVLGHDRRLGELEPAQPFHVHVAFEAGQQQPDRIAVRGPHPLAVLVETDERVIHALGERHAAAHRGGVGALGHHPFRARLDAGLVEQRREPHAGPFRTRDQAVNRLRVARLRLRGVERARIAGAFDEGDARLHRVARQRLEREHQRPFHQAVDQQPVLVGIDIGRAGMAAVEMQAVRRDRPVEQLKRGARGADPLGRRIGCRRNAPHHLALEPRRLAIGGKRRARLLHPVRHRKRLRPRRRPTPAPAGCGDAAHLRERPAG